MPEPYKICFLSYKENVPDDDPYNGHISRATTEEKIDPGILSGMTEKVTAHDGQRTVLELLKIHQEMKKCMALSGSHDSNLMNFVVAGIRHTKATNIDKFLAYYFFMESMDVPDFDFHFSSGLPPGLQIDSAIEVADLSDMSQSKPRSCRPSPRTAITDDQSQSRFIEAIEKAGRGNSQTETCKQELYTEMKINKVQHCLRNYKDMHDKETNPRVHNKQLQKTMQKLQQQLGIEPTLSDEE